MQSGLAANPNSYALHLRLGAAYLAAGRYGEAESVFRDLVSAGDPLPTGYVGLPQVLLRTGRAEEAAAGLGDAEKKLGPTFLISYFRGLALDRAGKPSEALAAFQQATHLNPNSADAHLHLGKTEFALSHVNESIAEFHEALRLDPGNIRSRLPESSDQECSNASRVLARRQRERSCKRCCFGQPQSSCCSAALCFLRLRHKRVPTMQASQISSTSQKKLG